MHDGSSAIENRLLNKLRFLLGANEESEEVEHLISDLPDSRPSMPLYGWSSLITKDLLFGSFKTNGLSAVPSAVRLVTYGVKPLALVYGPEVYTVELVRWSHRHGLFAAMGPFEFIPNADVGKGGFSNRVGSGVVATPGSGQYRQALIAHDDSVLLRAWVSLLTSNHSELGHALGFPECCIESFTKNWARAKIESQGDLATYIRRTMDAEPYDWRYNIFGRYFGFDLIQHFPCSYDCDATLRLATSYESVLKLHEPEHWRKLVALLAAPVVYTEHSGIFIFRGSTAVKYLGEWRVTYEPQLVITTVLKGRFWSLIQMAGEFTSPLSEPQIMVGEQQLSGTLIVFQ